MIRNVFAIYLRNFPIYLVEDEFNLLKIIFIKKKIYLIYSCSTKMNINTRTFHHHRVSIFSPLN